MIGADGLRNGFGWIDTNVFVSELPGAPSPFDDGQFPVYATETGKQIVGHFYRSKWVVPIGVDPSTVKDHGANVVLQHAAQP